MNDATQTIQELRKLGHRDHAVAALLNALGIPAPDATRWTGFVLRRFMGEWPVKETQP